MPKPKDQAAPSAASILAPDKEVTLANGSKVTVRELTWKQTKTLVDEAGEQVALILASGSAMKSGLRMCGELSDSLIKRCTDLDQEAIDNLTLADVLRLTDAATELNLRPDVIDLGKALAGRVRVILPAPAAPTSATPTTS